MADPAVACIDVAKVYPAGRTTEPITALDRVSFDVAAGESLGIVGESGSGKSTLARLLIGLEAPTSGSIRISGRARHSGRRGTSARRRDAKEIQIVFQDPYTSLDPRQRMGNALTEALRIHTSLDRNARRTRAAELLDLVGLQANLLDRRPSTLSGGQRQRVAIARALAPEPAILVLDEPVSALDVSIQAQILNLLSDIRGRTGLTYIFITHDLAVARQITDHLIVMRGGEVVEQGSIAQVLDHPQSPYTQRLRRSVPGPGWKPVREASSTGTS